MRIRQLAAALLGLCGFATGMSQEWVDTSEPDRLLSFGVRTGFNTSNATRTDKGSAANLDSWGTGFDAGVVANLNFNNSVSLQPGFFFQSRSHNYSYVIHHPEEGMPNVHEYGHTLCRSFQVPVMGIFKMHPSESLVWSIEFGPYFNFGLSGSDKGTQEIGMETRAYSDGYYDNRKKFDFGFKMGTGIQVLDHYYLGIHYECGACNVWNHYEGRNKAWTFTIGYDF